MYASIKFVDVESIKKNCIIFYDLNTTISFLIISTHPHQYIFRFLYLFIKDNLSVYYSMSSNKEF